MKSSVKAGIRAIEQPSYKNCPNPDTNVNAFPHASLSIKMLKKINTFELEKFFSFIESVRTKC